MSSIRGSNCGRARFSAPVQTGLGAHAAIYKWVPRLFPGAKRPGCGVNHPPHQVPRLKKEYIYTTTLHLYLHGRLLGKVYLYYYFSPASIFRAYRIPFPSIARNDGQHGYIYFGLYSYSLGYVREFLLLHLQ